MEVAVVEGIEDVDGRLGDDAADVELLGEAQVERGVLIVLAPEIARDCAARTWKCRRSDRQAAILWRVGRLAVDTQRQRLRRTIRVTHVEIESHRRVPQQP